MDDLYVNFKWQEGDVLWIYIYIVMYARQLYIGDRLTLASIDYKYFLKRFVINSC